jgi:hypothetical protein
MHMARSETGGRQPRETLRHEGIQSAVVPNGVNKERLSPTPFGRHKTRGRVGRLMACRGCRELIM